MNKWIAFLREFRKKNPSLSMKEAMRKGAVAYKASKKGGDAKKTKTKAKRTKKKNDKFKICPV